MSADTALQAHTAAASARPVAGAVVPDDEPLVAAAAAGDHAAFAALVRRHQAAALRVALALLRDHALAEDAVQEAFVAVHRDLSRFDARRPFLPWLLGAVAHRARAAARARRRLALREWSFDPRAWFRPRSANSVDDPLLENEVRHEAARELWAAIARLPGAQRRVVVLHYFGDLSVEDTAVALRCPAGTVKSRLHHARRALAALLSDPPDPPEPPTTREHDPPTAPPAAGPTDQKGSPCEADQT